MTTDRDFCASAFVALRYVPSADAAWAPGVVPGLPGLTETDQVPVGTSAEIVDFLRAEVAAEKNPAIFLSGGIDSAILARLMPAGSPAYTIRFEAEGAVDESTMAAKYAQEAGLDLRVVTATWADYDRWTDPLAAYKRSPLHAAEVGLYLAARAAADDGFDRVLVGNGADSTFGGMDKLLSRDWTFDEFVERYTFVQPDRVLRRPVSMLPEYEKYRRGQGIDVLSFLKKTHGIGIVQAFENALGMAGVTAVAPYEHLRMAGQLDIARIRAGEPKYLLQEVFHSLYPTLDAPAKIPFARPMDHWLRDWSGPTSEEFRDDLDIADFSGEQRWVLHTLDRFLRATASGAGA